MPPRPKVRVLRDIKARQGVADNEISRRAYLYVARNQTLPAQVRYQAQLQLNAFGRYTRPTTVKNRCTATGRGRGVIGESGLCRVRERVLFCFPLIEREAFSLGSLRRLIDCLGVYSTSFNCRPLLESCQAFTKPLGRGYRAEWFITWYVSIMRRHCWR